MTMTSPATTGVPLRCACLLTTLCCQYFFCGMFSLSSVVRICKLSIFTVFVGVISCFGAVDKTSFLVFQRTVKYAISIQFQYASADPCPFGPLLIVTSYSTYRCTFSVARPVTFVVCFYGNIILQQQFTVREIYILKSKSSCVTAGLRGARDPTPPV